MNPFSLNSNWILTDLKVKKWFLGASKSATDACYYPIIFLKNAVFRIGTASAIKL